MIGLIRSASLTNYAEVARRAGLEPHRHAGRVRAAAAVPARAGDEVPIDAVRRLLEASAERSGIDGVRAADGRGAPAVEPRAARAADPRTADAPPRLEALARYSNASTRRCS